MVGIVSRVVSAVFGGYFRRRAAHADDVRRVVTELRSFLHELTAAGGFGSSDFLTDDAKRREQELADLIDRVRDRKLKRACEDVLDGYKRAWGSSPGHRHRVTVAEEPEPIFAGRMRPEDQAQLQRQVDAARDALAAIQRVLDRLNRIERWLTPC